MDFSIFSSFLPEKLLSHFDIVEFKELKFGYKTLCGIFELQITKKKQ